MKQQMQAHVRKGLQSFKTDFDLQNKECSERPQNLKMDKMEEVLKVAAQNICRKSRPQFCNLFERYTGIQKTFSSTKKYSTSCQWSQQDVNKRIHQLYPGK